jgi:hypothetical protein
MRQASRYQVQAAMALDMAARVSARAVAAAPYSQKVFSVTIRLERMRFPPTAPVPVQRSMAGAKAAA